MTDWFRSLPGYRQKIYLLLIIAILLTLPCYCIGIALLILAPEAEPAPGDGAQPDLPGSSRVPVSYPALAGHDRL